MEIGVGDAGAAAVKEMADELLEMGAGGGKEDGFGRAGAGGDLELAVEGLAGEGGADAGELEAVEEKGELGGGAEAELAGGGLVEGGAAVDGRFG